MRDTLEERKEAILLQEIMTILNNILAIYLFHLILYYSISKVVINNNNLSQLVINSKKDIPSHNSS